jgi:hypothetical protein
VFSKSSFWPPSCSLNIVIIYFVFFEDTLLFLRENFVFVFDNSLIPKFWIPHPVSISRMEGRRICLPRVVAKSPGNHFPSHYTRLFAGLETECSLPLLYYL